MVQEIKVYLLRSQRRPFLARTRTGDKPLIYTYEEFAGVVLQLEDEGILEMIKAKGRNSRTLNTVFISIY